MLLLTIDTSTPDLIVGLVNHSDSAFELVIDHSRLNCRDHNEQLVPTIQDALVQTSRTFGDVDGVVLGQGPGPFTGLRVGMATGIAIADARGIPVYPVCSSDAIANTARRKHGAGALQVATDARRREVYSATYDEAGNRISDPEVIKPEELELRATTLAVPENPPRLREIFLARNPELNFLPASPDPLGLAEAVADFDNTILPVVPLYLRRPDATVPQNIKKAIP
ncbi:MAG: tRNA (adenosine(37)-N6)-threonylcarbamoyltransferase complex dimerization subunit type 1 TsaB [Corynebacterium sp.]|nr:tRNA (adenosine(37)-N6)-threonylcarbamoyltransferase complex dimerization subunit type 1 TsaB [Corynebacterium sp.]